MVDAVAPSVTASETAQNDSWKRQPKFYRKAIEDSLPGDVRELLASVSYRLNMFYSLVMVRIPHLQMSGRTISPLTALAPP